MKTRSQKKTFKPQRMKKKKDLRLRRRQRKKPPDWLPKGLQMAKMHRRRKKQKRRLMKMNELCILKTFVIYVMVRKNSGLNNSVNQTLPFMGSTKPMTTHSYVDNSKVRTVREGVDSSTFITEPNQESLFGRPTQNLQQFF